MQVGGVTRVNGNLNLSRAIGDLRYKSNAEISPEKQIISAQVGMCWVPQCRLLCQIDRPAQISRCIQ